MLLNSILYINLASSTYWSNKWGVLQSFHKEYLRDSQKNDLTSRKGNAIF